VVARALAAFIVIAASLSASDKDDTRAALSNIQSALVRLDSEIVQLKRQIAMDQSSMLKRTNSFNKGLKDLSDRVDDLDVSHVNASVSAESSRLTVLETNAKQTQDEKAKDDADQKARSETILGFAKSGFTVMLASVVGFIMTAAGSYFHRRHINEKLDKVSDEIEVVRKDVNSTNAASILAAKDEADQRLAEAKTAAFAQGRVEGHKKP
jgi:hypothetical protein